MGLKSRIEDKLEQEEESNGLKGTLGANPAPKWMKKRLEEYDAEQEREIKIAELKSKIDMLKSRIEDKLEQEEESNGLKGTLGANPAPKWMKSSSSREEGEEYDAELEREIKIAELKSKIDMLKKEVENKMEQMEEFNAEQERERQ